MEFNKEERAAIARDFREDIKKYGVRAAVENVLLSRSEKVAVRRTVLVQQCRKPSFRKQFDIACEQIKSSMPGMRLSVRQLIAEVDE